MPRLQESSIQARLLSLQYRRPAICRQIVKLASPGERLLSWHKSRRSGYKVWDPSIQGCGGRLRQTLHICGTCSQDQRYRWLDLIVCDSPTQVSQGSDRSPPSAHATMAALKESALASSSERATLRQRICLAPLNG